MTNMELRYVLDLLSSLLYIYYIYHYSYIKTFTNTLFIQLVDYRSRKRAVVYKKQKTSHSTNSDQDDQDSDPYDQIILKGNHILTNYSWSLLTLFVSI